MPKGKYCTLSELAVFLRDKNGSATIEEAIEFGLSEAMLNSLQTSPGKGGISISGNTLTLSVDAFQEQFSRHAGAKLEHYEQGVLDRNLQHFTPAEGVTLEEASEFLKKTVTRYARQRNLIVSSITYPLSNSRMSLICILVLPNSM